MISEWDPFCNRVVQIKKHFSMILNNNNNNINWDHCLTCRLPPQVKRGILDFLSRFFVRKRRRGKTFRGFSSIPLLPSRLSLSLLLRGALPEGGGT